MYAVILTRGTCQTVYGTYGTRDEAERQADAHRETGYFLVEIRQGT